MAIAYPTDVPDCIEKGSLNRTPVDTVLRTPSDIGRPMMRNRYTGRLYRVSWVIKMTSAEVELLLDWYFDTISKVNYFDFVDPLTDEMKQYRFVSPPKDTHIGGDHFSVTFDLET